MMSRIPPNLLAPVVWYLGCTPDPELGVPLTAQSLALGEATYYRVVRPGGQPLTAGQHVFVLLDKVSGWHSSLSLAKGVLPSYADDYCWRDQAVELVMGAGG